MGPWVGIAAVLPYLIMVSAPCIGGWVGVMIAMIVLKIIRKRAR